MTDIGRLKELEAETVQGPWTVEVDAGVEHINDGRTPKHWVAECAHGQAEFIAEFRNAAPHLLSEIETLRAALKLFLDDDRFNVAIGGNPVAVEKMLAFARAAYDQGKVT